MEVLAVADRFEGESDPGLMAFDYYCIESAKIGGNENWPTESEVRSWYESIKAYQNV